MEKIYDSNDGKEKGYRFQCSCLMPEEAMDISVEEIDERERHVEIAMYYTANGVISKIKAAWKVLRGRWRWSDIVVRNEDLKGLSEILDPERKIKDMP